MNAWSAINEIAGPVAKQPAWSAGRFRLIASAAGAAGAFAALAIANASAPPVGHPVAPQPVREQIQLIDRLGSAASGNEKKLMAGHFILSSRYEFMFWEQAYRLETWPV